MPRSRAFALSFAPRPEPSNSITSDKFVAPSCVTVITTCTWNIVRPTRWHPNVEKLWYCGQYQVAHSKERVLPSGRFQLIIDLAESSSPPLMVGMRSEY